MVTINADWAGGVAAPFGGRRKPGYGRKKGREGLDACLVAKATANRV